MSHGVVTSHVCNFNSNMADGDLSSSQSFSSLDETGNDTSGIELLETHEISPWRFEPPRRHRREDEVQNHEAPAEDRRNNTNW